VNANNQSVELVELVELTAQLEALQPRDALFTLGFLMTVSRWVGVINAFKGVWERGIHPCNPAGSSCLLVRDEV